MTLERTARLLFAGGGTGGHLYPAIAIADRVRDLLADEGGADIHFVGTKRGLEYRLRDTLGYPLHLVNMRGIVRSMSLKNLLLPFVVTGALIKATGLLKQLKPDIVVGTGGYVAWPVLNRAAARGIPTVLQEQNSFPGVVTRRAADKARCIYLGFAGATTHLPEEARIRVTGNPVRTSIGTGQRKDAIKAFDLDPEKKTILILGGSQGARAVNRAVLRDLNEKALDKKFQILWQTGKGDYKEVAATAGDKVSRRALFPFAENMPTVYAAADLAIARAGALTLAELMTCNIPALLIPYPHAAGDHQRKNAVELSDHGMAEVIDEARLDEVNLLTEATTLIQSRRYEAMREALQAYNKDRKPAVDVIAEDIVRIINERKAGS
ncbi:MAG TPA: undecaprenyldiphospho-muramoylpentapeptide beta-N-acetylglucosaminyltransferase [candidate division Zixibacteria bacterium]|nr:undecaprenyldiphospho-muramoylpentapeptide beta-N-acetylglucosaminyltransferase [candidate division Zixibacteria bacterium]